MGILLYGFYQYLKSSKKQFGTTFEITSVLTFILLFLVHNKAPSILISSVYYMIPICLIIVSISLEQGKISAFLINRRFVLLGEVSFAFYMIHQLIIRYYLKITTVPILSYFFVDISLLLIISVILSYLLYHQVEMKFKNMIRYYYKNRL